MQVLLAALVILVTVAAWTWRLRMAQRKPESARVPEEVSGPSAYRRSVQYRAGKGGIDLIEDPREAAAIMLMMMARAGGGPLSGRQSDIIEAEIAAHFDFSEYEAEDLAAHAAWVASSQLPGEEEMRRLSRLIMHSSQLGAKEVIDLDAMLVAVSEAEGLPSRAQLSLLQIYRDMAGLKT